MAKGRHFKLTTGNIFISDVTKMSHQSLTTNRSAFNAENVPTFLCFFNDMFQK